MKKHLLTLATVLFAAGALFTSCANDPEEPQIQSDGTQISTRAYGDKSPKIMVYVETNDVNPLNALCWEMNDKKFIDILNLFASNIHKDADGYPTVYLNDKLTRILEPDPNNPTETGFHKYVEPLQAAGIKVCMTSLGDWQGIGLSNMTPQMADRYADILVYCVDRYGLDGINLDDEYSAAEGTVYNSYSHVIKALHAKLDAKFGVGKKLITVFQWGAYNQIDVTAGGMIDYADHGTFGPNVFISSSSILGVTNDRWMPQAIKLGNSYVPYLLQQITNRSSETASGNYAGIMMFNLRPANDVSPQPVFQAIADGAYNSATVSNVCETPYTQDWTFIPGGFELTKDDVPAYAPTYTGN